MVVAAQHRLHDTGTLDIHGAFAKRMAAAGLGPQDRIGKLQNPSFGSHCPSIQSFFEVLHDTVDSLSSERERETVISEGTVRIFCEDGVKKRRGKGRRLSIESFASHVAFDIMIRGGERFCN
jgi:hypothetical protein